MRWVQVHATDDVAVGRVEDGERETLVLDEVVCIQPHVGQLAPPKGRTIEPGSAQSVIVITTAQSAYGCSFRLTTPASSARTRVNLVMNPYSATTLS